VRGGVAERHEILDAVIVDAADVMHLRGRRAARTPMTLPAHDDAARAMERVRTPRAGQAKLEAHLGVPGAIGAARERVLDARERWLRGSNPPLSAWCRP
jgi:hypothetical protein